MQDSKRDTDIKNRLLDYVGEGESGTVWENSIEICIFSSVQFSRSVVSNSLRPHALQHARLPCPPLSPRVYSNSCSLSQWCHPTISSSVVPFSCLQSFPASGSYFIFHSSYFKFLAWLSTFTSYLSLILLIALAVENKLHSLHFLCLIIFTE